MPSVPPPCVACVLQLMMPRLNDSFLVRWASRAFYTELLEAGVEIYLFEDGLLHEKCPRG